jgi:hypothetical protein
MTELYYKSSRGKFVNIAPDELTDYPVMYAGLDRFPCLSFSILSTPPRIASAVAWTGASYCELGVLIRVTQKHLAIPPSSLIKVMLRPRSARVFMFPRSIHDGASVQLSAGGEII